MKDEGRLLQGTLDLLVMKALEGGPLHGYGIARWIRETSGELEIEEGALYHSLHRLERQGLLRAQWGRSENNRRARFYELSPKGIQQLAKQTRNWRRYAAAVFRILGSPIKQA